MAQRYDDTSIGLLKGATRIRKRPASMLGSSGLAGARHGFIEMYGNALDEKNAGFGNQLDVTYHKDGSITLRDYGRGVPLGWNEEEKTWNWHAVYNELYGGGKYEDNQEALRNITDWSNFNPLDFIYLFSVGLNGLGAASTQYTSEFFEVHSYRDGQCKSRSFNRGIPLVNGVPFDMFNASQEEIEALEEEVSETDEANGTYVHWKPDDTVFDDINIGGDWLLDTCKDITGVAGISMHFVDEVNDKDIFIEAGTLKTVMEDHCGNSLVRDDNGDNVSISTNTFQHGNIKVEGKDFIWVCMCDIVFGFTKSHVDNSCYHNSVKMASGVQYEGIRDAVSTFMTERGKAAGVRIDRRDFEDAFNVVVSTYSNYASFRNQTKDAVDDMFIYYVVRDCMLNKLQIEFGKNNQYVVGVVNRVIEDAKNRIAAQELHELTKKANKAKREKAPEKFSSCEAYEDKDYDIVEIWFTEGDSAARSVKSARNSKFQAVFPLRGKGLNVAKASDKRILENKEIREMFAILGTGFNLHAKNAKFFNIEELKVGKIIIATDADEDGYQIRVLLFLMFYKLAPELLSSGRVFIAETPRFGIDLSDGTRIYARNDKERDELVSKNSGRVVKINRYKGLGEVDADILRETTVHPDTRTLIPVTCDFSNQAECDLIDALFGADKYGQRKMIISTVLGSDVTDMLEDTALMLGEIEDSDIESGVDIEEVVM